MSERKVKENNTRYLLECIGTGLLAGSTGKASLAFVVNYLECINRLHLDEQINYLRALSGKKNS